MITCNELINGGDKNFKSFVEIPSWPEEDFDLMECKVFVIVPSSTNQTGMMTKCYQSDIFHSYVF